MRNLSLFILLTLVSAAPAHASQTSLITRDTFIQLPNMGSPDVSGDGRTVVFHASEFDPFTNSTGPTQIHFSSRLNGGREQISLSSANELGNGDSEDAHIGANGQVVVFQSEATNLVSNDNNDRDDIFLRNLDTGVTQLISRTSAGVPGDNNSRRPDISPNGRFIVYDSQARNIAGPDNDDSYDVMFHDRVTGVTEKLTPDTSGTNPSIDSFGRFVAFESTSRFVVPNDTNQVGDIFVRDRSTDTTARVSVSTSGVQANARSQNPSISANGQWIVFESLANNLVPGDTNGVSDIFLHDRVNGTTERVSVSTGGFQADDISVEPDVSGTGRYVSYRSFAGNLVSNDTNGASDIFVFDRQLGFVRRESERSDEGSIGTSSGFAREAALSTDGRHVVFMSSASFSPEDGDNVNDIYHRDRGGDCDTNDSRNRFVLPNDSWQLLSLPCEPPQGSTIGGIFSDDIQGIYGEDWVVFSFNATLEEPQYEDAGLNFAPRPGQGFWIIQITGNSVTLDLPRFSRGAASIYSYDFADPTSCIGTLGCRPLSLSGATHPLDNNGVPSVVLWNLLGSVQRGIDNPVDFDDLRIATSSGPCAKILGGCSLDDAVTSAINVLANVVFAYDGTTYQTIDSGDSISPWQGLWVGELDGSVGRSPVLYVPESFGFAF